MERASLHEQKSSASRRLRLCRRGRGFTRVKLFLDSANLEEAKTAARWGVLAGVTTNPSLIAKEGVALEQRIAELCRVVDGPVNAEVTETDADAMVAQGEALAAIDPRVVIKVPMLPEGLEACHRLAARGHAVNVTLIFSVNQALLAARAGAAYVSPFVGRLDDLGHDGIQLVAEIAEVFQRHRITTQVLAASIRHPLHVQQAALAGADIATLPFAVMRRMFDHPLTAAGQEQFLRDWREASARLDREAPAAP